MYRGSHPGEIRFEGLRLTPEYGHRIGMLRGQLHHTKPRVGDKDKTPVMLPLAN